MSHRRPVRSGLGRHWALWFWVALPMAVCLGGVALWKSGRWLVHNDDIDHVRWGLVLAGESRDCERSDAAIRMYRDGKIDTLIISACRVFKNRYQSEFMVDYYVQQGVARDRLFEFRQDAYSTLEEARLLVRQFRFQNLDTVLIITTSFHTARTRRIFRKLAQGYPVVLVAAADYNVYDPGAWWSNRESRKLWFDEWAKTVFTWFELARAPAENGKAEYQGLFPDVWAARLSGEAPRSGGALPANDTAMHSPAKADSAGMKSPSAPGAFSPADSGKESSKASPTGEGKADGKADAEAETKMTVDSALAVKADSAKARRDSLKSAAGKPLAEAKPALKPGKETKKPSTPVKGPSKIAEKKSEKNKAKK